MTEPRELLAGLHLLDHQIVDRDGWLAGNVDDLELEVGEDPWAEPPVVVDLLSGAGALAARIGGRLGRFIASVDGRIAEERTPARIPMAVVSEIGSHVTVTSSRSELETDRGERWVRNHVIDHIPGSGHAAD